VIWRDRRRTPSAYDQARNRAVELWDLLFTEADPSARREIYRGLNAAYNHMAETWVPDDVPGGYDSDFAEDLGDMAALCWVLAASEEALASPGSEGRPVPLQNIPGAADSPPLAAAWEQFWEAGERAERARLLRGHLGDPVARGELRRPVGIIPLYAGRVGSVVTGLLEAAADTEEWLAELLAIETAAR
jgi:hypothetical protein